MGAECSVPCSANNTFDKLQQAEVQQAREAAARDGRQWFERKGTV